jgi:hypothetical protein
VRLRRGVRHRAHARDSWARLVCQIGRFRLDPRDRRTDAEYHELVGDDAGVFGCMSLLACHNVRRTRRCRRGAFIRRKMVRIYADLRRRTSPRGPAACSLFRNVDARQHIPQSSRVTIEGEVRWSPVGRVGLPGLEGDPSTRTTASELRGKENFNITGIPMSMEPYFVKAFGMKKAAALANRAWRA